jgi:hypothetical protein
MRLFGLPWNTLNPAIVPFQHQHFRCVTLQKYGYTSLTEAILIEQENFRNFLPAKSVIVQKKAMRKGIFTLLLVLTMGLTACEQEKVEPRDDSQQKQDEQKQDSGSSNIAFPGNGSGN